MRFTCPPKTGRRSAWFTTTARISAVNVQLINAQTDSQLWADTYDRKLTDILGGEGDIAKRIAESLQARLTGREEQALAVKPTNNTEAYDAYLRGLSSEERSIISSTADLYGPARCSRRWHRSQPGTIPTSNNPRDAITGYYLDSNNTWHGFLRGAPRSQPTPRPRPAPAPRPTL